MKGKISGIEKKFFLRTRLAHIKEDIRKEQGKGLLDYKKTLIRIYELCESYGINQHALSEWMGWHDFCDAYKAFLRGVGRINW
ncbi:MAG: hypothetical protein AAB736_00485 [Patescibacteria group bacterium]